jgi:hypothetical protein
MSLLRLTDGRMYEMRETASEMFDFLLGGDQHGWVYLLVRQPGRRSARYKGLTVRQDHIASVDDDGLGHAVKGDNDD